MAVSLTSLRTDSYTTMYNHLQTGTYALTTNNIHPHYNDKQFKEEGLPQVIILVNTVREKQTIGRENHLWNAMVTYSIVVYHNSAASARTLADDVVNKIITGKAVFYAVGLKNLQWEEDDYEVQYYGANKSMHKYTIDLSFRKMGVQ